MDARSADALYEADAGFSSWCFTSSFFFWMWTPASRVEASGGINIVHASLLVLQWCRVARAIAVVSEGGER